MATAVNDSILYATLKEVFGYHQFRGNQIEIIRNILNGKDSFVIMPTGAGKSLCYQLPAIVSEGTAVVISPLIALMKNQVDQLNGFGVSAHFLNSTLSRADLVKVKEDVSSGVAKLLYVAPESLSKEVNINFLKTVKLSFLAIDEAHCISEWGHDFRPEYRKIRGIVESLGNLPIIALTATATPKVKLDIRKNLKIEEAALFTSSFLRPNLFYEIYPKHNPDHQLIRFIRRFKKKSGIIYCLSRRTVDEVSAFLNVNKISALPYHAGMDAATRMHNQDAFLNEDVDVIVATIAFGMGIDKPDVRFVVHYDTPKSLEGYYQETGRAGRDGLPSSCMMLYSAQDIQRFEKFNKDKSAAERENARFLLREITYYASCAVCRPRQLLHYFGEYMSENCGNCDNCKDEHKKEFDGKTHLKTAIKTVQETRERFAIDHITDVIVGQMTEYVESYGHHKLDTFGRGKKEGKSFWESVVRQAMIYKFLSKDSEDILTLKLTEEGKAFLKKPYSLTLSHNHDFSEKIKAKTETHAGDASSGKAYDEDLFKMLIALRKKEAKRKKLPPYVIFQEPSLEEMATTYPRTEQELIQINGVGKGKVKKFGPPFLQLIKKYVQENDITTVSDVVVRSGSDKKSKAKITIITQIDRKVNLEDIAQQLQMEYEDLITEIENICFSGTKLRLDYFLNQLIDQERQKEIYDYFMRKDSEDIEDALHELADEADEDAEEEIRLMRIKFFSEVAL